MQNHVKLLKCILNTYYTMKHKTKEIVDDVNNNRAK
jgi:hypothetical protein